MPKFTFRSASALFMLVSLSLSGCSNQTRQVEASLSLVSPTDMQVGDIIPDKYWPALDDPQTTQVNADGLMISVGPKYTSSLGLECRALQMATNPNENRTRIACTQAVEQAEKTVQAWFLTNNIVETSTVIKIQ